MENDARASTATSRATYNRQQWGKIVIDKGVFPEAWIDVGGTFTDCILHHDGNLTRTKVLSSGATPLRVSPNANQSANHSAKPRKISCDADWPAGFWRGSQLWTVAGEHASVEIVDSGRDWLEIADALEPTAGRLEIRTHLHAPVLGVHLLLGIPVGEPLPPISVRLGTTRGTNALLTRRGARTALAITAPLEDLLAIGDQTRPSLFTLDIHKSPPLASLTIGIDERIDAAGEILKPLDKGAAQAKLQKAYDDGVEAIAICLMHSYQNPEHERQLAEIARSIGFPEVSVSSEIAPLIEIVSRAQTTVLDAYLSPVVRSYLREINEQLGGPDVADLQVMTSAGGLVNWDGFRGKDSILSGPAGGVVALEQIRHALGQEALIGLDMGGTSTDVCRADGAQHLEVESSKAGVRILSPTVPIETVAAGGGSICWFDGVSLRVGPQSAGSTPGPACYGAGGPLTLTDINLLLGYLPASQFPFPLEHHAAETRLEGLLQECRQATGINETKKLAEGLRRIACEQMAEAVRTVSIAKGRDPRDHALVGFGGAAGCHVCEVAELLGIETVIDHPDAGLLSALGMGLAPRRADTTLPVYKLIDEVDWESLRQRVLAAFDEMISEDGSPSCVVELRYTGTDATISLAEDSLLTSVGRVVDSVSEEANRILHEAFQAKHQQLYGYTQDIAIEMVSVRCERLRQSEYSLPSEAIFAAGSPPPVGSATPGKGTASFPELQRDLLQPGVGIVGPCIVNNDGSTLAIGRDWEAVACSNGTLAIRYLGKSPGAAADDFHSREVASARPDAIARDCFAQRLSAIAQQMGEVLKRTSMSVNVKQRQDYSCAIFDAWGTLLANAAHVPVHLGAMGATVRGVLKHFPGLKPGDCFVTNDPFEGGSHLPDITVITPVFNGDGALAFFVASRAHHADVGGIAPGSMSVTATNLAEEGVLIEPKHLSASGKDMVEELVAAMQQQRWPPRKIGDLQADLNAQRAANHRGAGLLSEYCRQLSWGNAATLAEELLVASQQKMELYLRSRFELGKTYSATDSLEDGTRIAVSLKSTATGRLLCDFAGSGPTSKTNLNANPSIVSAALLYVLRCLVDDDLPMNEGVLRCVELKIPQGVLNPQRGPAPEQSPAVAAGNVETSQRIVDVLLMALGEAACSQGTMNNLLFGDASFGFYETLCGGSGATRRSCGASAVHTHMTNTRLTDPEVLESRYPVRLEAFGIRDSSGGCGRNRGGDGVIRQIRFLKDVQISLLTSRRGQGPHGINGGGDGVPGRNLAIEPNGEVTELPAFFSGNMPAGSQLRIETPGGGGFGPPELRP